MERIEGLTARGQDINRAWLMGMAFADGKALKAETEKHDAELRRRPGTPPGTLDDAAVADIARVIASWTPKAPAEVC